LHECLAAYSGNENKRGSKQKRGRSLYPGWAAGKKACRRIPACSEKQQKKGREKMLQAILILAVMIIMMCLMVTNKVPILIAIPMMAIGVALAGGVPLTGEESIVTSVIVNGTSRNMVSGVLPVLLASWLGCIMNKTGISETMIRKAAELGGDRTLVVALLMYGVVMALSTTLGGLGAFIMMASIVYPILISTGVNKVTAASIMLVAYGTGGHYGPSHAVYYSSIFGIDQMDCYKVMLVLSIVTTIVGIAFIVFSLKKNGKSFAFAATSDAAPEYKLSGIRGILAMCVPLIPILCVILLKLDVVTAYLIAVIWAVVMTAAGGWKKTTSLISETLYDGFRVAAPGASLLIFMGMLVNAINCAPVQNALIPLVNAITPTNPWLFAAMFAVLAPFAMYRGPINLYGLGTGIAALMVAGGIVSPMMVCVGFMGARALQESSDPANTHCVWSAGYLEVDELSFIKRHLPWMWAAAAITIFICTGMFWAA